MFLQARLPMQCAWFVTSPEAAPVNENLLSPGSADNCVWHGFALT